MKKIKLYKKREIAYNTHDIPFGTKESLSAFPTLAEAFSLYRKDRLRRSLELKIARTKAGMTKQTVASLEDIEPFFTEIVIKIVII